MTILVIPLSRSGISLRRDQPVNGGVDGVEPPVDLAAVQADDTLLTTLGGQRSPSDTGAELVRMLIGWRRDVESEPFGDLLDLDTAAAAIGAGLPQRRFSRVQGLLVALLVCLVVWALAAGAATLILQAVTR